MELKTKIFGTINGKEIENNLIILNSSLDIETIKKEFTAKIFEDTKRILKDNERYLEKNPDKKKFVKEINEFIIQQFKQTNIFKIVNTTDTTNEIEIIQLDNKEKYIKKIEEMTKND